MWVRRHFLYIVKGVRVDWYILNLVRGGFDGSTNLLLTLDITLHVVELMAHHPRSVFFFACIYCWIKIHSNFLTAINSSLVHYFFINFVHTPDDSFSIPDNGFFHVLV